MKTIAKRKPAKDEREKAILFGLIELYLKEGKPIGSNTLKDAGFDSFSSATIRNYFTKLEEEGFLKQQHSSGGRIPTIQALRLYASSSLEDPLLSAKEGEEIYRKLKKETREIGSYLMQAVERISEMTGCAAFLSAPRFDQDFILEIKLVAIDLNRVLAVLITDFGLIKNEILYIEKKLSLFALKRIETYLNWRVTGLEKPTLSQEEEQVGSLLYKEILLRHIVSQTNFSAEDLFQAGFSRLLHYSDFNDASAIAGGLALFENKGKIRSLLDSVLSEGKLCCFMGEDLSAYVHEASSCCIIAIPYKINHAPCGAIGILGPARLPFRELFGKFQAISEVLSDSLTKSVYKFKLSFRTPKSSPAYPELTNKQTILLENQSSKDVS